MGRHCANQVKEKPGPGRPPSTRSIKSLTQVQVKMHPLARPKKTLSFAFRLRSVPSSWISHSWTCAVNWRRL